MHNMPRPPSPFNRGTQITTVAVVAATAPPWALLALYALAWVLCPSTARRASLPLSGAL